jgi:hypothetical protein
MTNAPIAARINAKLKGGTLFTKHDIMHFKSILKYSLVSTMAFISAGYSVAQAGHEAGSRLAHLTS